MKRRQTIIHDGTTVREGEWLNEAPWPDIIATMDAAIARVYEIAPFIESVHIEYTFQKPLPLVRDGN